MNTKQIKFADVPEWTINPVPSALSFFEAIALAGLEGKSIRLSAETQRKLIGFPVFGKLKMRVQDGEVTLVKSVCFGTDYNTAVVGIERIKQAAAERKALRVE